MRNKLSLLLTLFLFSPVFAYLYDDFSTPVLDINKWFERGDQYQPSLYNPAEEGVDYYLDTEAEIFIK